VVESDNIDAARWRKILWSPFPCISSEPHLKSVNRNASLSTMCTLTRCNIATMMKESTSAATVENLRAIMAEVKTPTSYIIFMTLIKFELQVLTVARHLGIASPELTEDVAEAIINNTQEQYGYQNPKPSQFRPSMLVDLENGRPLEVEAIVGGIIRAARSVDVAVPR
jgi:2-dehydropantoate 2-reductase